MEDWPRHGQDEVYGLSEAPWRDVLEIPHGFLLESTGLGRLTPVKKLHIHNLWDENNASSLQGLIMVNLPTYGIKNKVGYKLTHKLGSLLVVYPLIPSGYLT